MVYSWLKRIATSINQTINTPGFTADDPAVDLCDGYDDRPIFVALISPKKEVTGPGVAGLRPTAIDCGEVVAHGLQNALLAKTYPGGKIERNKTLIVNASGATNDSTPAAGHRYQLWGWHFSWRTTAGYNVNPVPGSFHLRDGAGQFIDIRAAPRLASIDDDLVVMLPRPIELPLEEGAGEGRIRLTNSAFAPVGTLEVRCQLFLTDTDVGVIT